MSEISAKLLAWTDGIIERMRIGRVAVLTEDKGDDSILKEIRSLIARSGAADELAEAADRLVIHEPKMAGIPIRFSPTNAVVITREQGKAIKDALAAYRTAPTPDVVKANTDGYISYHDKGTPFVSSDDTAPTPDVQEKEKS
jgi:hypothetical protein